MSPQLIAVGIDRDSPIPLYHQLARQFTDAISDGHLQPGDPFENEVALGKRLQVSRPTVRRAIQEMVDQGLLIRRRGLGTWVANRKVHRKFELSSLYDELEREGRKPSTLVLERETVVNERAASALDLPSTTPLLSILRVRMADGSPLALLHNWLPPVHAYITREDLEQTGLYAALRAQGCRPVVARQSIGARKPTSTERRHLRIRNTQPVLTMTRMAFDFEGNAIEFGEHCYRSEDYTIDLMVDER